MKKIEIIVKHRGDQDEESWKETINCPDGIPAEGHARAIIAAFNNSLRPYEKRRELVRVIGESDLPPDHDWEKQNLVTIMDRAGSHDNYRCQVCGITARRYGIGEIKRDGKFSAEKYQFCIKSEKSGRKQDDQITDSWERPLPKFIREAPIRPGERIYFIYCENGSQVHLTWDMCQARQSRGNCNKRCRFLLPENLPLQCSKQTRRARKNVEEIVEQNLGASEEEK